MNKFWERFTSSPIERDAVESPNGELSLPVQPRNRGEEIMVQGIKDSQTTLAINQEDFKKEVEKQPPTAEQLKSRLDFLALSGFVSSKRNSEMQDAFQELQEMLPGSLASTLQEEKLSALLALVDIERQQARELFSGAFSQEKFPGQNNNEDQAAIISDGLFLVADGMGGMEGGGKAASEQIVKFIGEYVLQEKWDKKVSSTEAEAQMRQLYKAIIESFNELHKDRKLIGASTLTLCRVIEQGSKEELVVLQVGDSPLYEYTEENGLVKVEVEPKENTYLWNLMSLEQRHNGVYEVTMKMIDECKGDLVTHPVTKKRMFDFELPEYDKVPDGYRTRSFIKKARKTVTDGITRSNQTGFAYRANVITRGIPNKYTKYFVFSDGITDNLSADDLKIAVSESMHDLPLNGRKVIQKIVELTDDQVTQIKAVDISRNISERESLAKIDDESGVLFDMASTLSAEELDVFELFSKPSRIQSIEDLSERLASLEGKVVSIAKTKEGQEVQVLASDVLNSVTKFDTILKNKSSEGYLHFQNYLKEKGWKEGDSEESLLDHLGRYLNNHIRNFPSGFKIRATAARLFTKKYLAPITPQ